MVHQVLQRFGFQFSSPQPTPLSTSHLLSAPLSNESVELSGPYPELVGCLMYLMTCTGPDLAYPLSLLAHNVATGRHRKVHWDAAKRVLHFLCSTSGIRLVLGGRGPVVLTDHADASWVEDSATQRSSQGYIFSLGSGSVSWRSTRSSSVLSSSCEAEIYAGAMAAQELRWLTYLLTDLGEQPRSPPVLYVDNKAMTALCQKHRLEHRTKHIALRYFLARELQQRGQLRLAYVATRANTADVFTKALPPGDHQCFVTVLDLGPAPSSVSQVDPLPGTVPVEVAVDSGAASRGVEPASAEPGGGEPKGAESGGTEHEGTEPGGAESECAESGGAEPRGIASAVGPAGASPHLSPRREPLSVQKLREWFAQRTRLRSGAAGAGGSATRGTGARGVGATSPGGAGVPAGAGGTRVSRAASFGGALTRGTRAAGASGVGGAGAGGAGAGELEALVLEALELEPLEL
ncbi:unnamed protein product [Closterium sp. NIES-54]